MKTQLILIMKTKIIKISKTISNFKKNKSNNKFKYHNDNTTTRDNDKFNHFYNNSKLFKKSKNEIDNKEFNIFICEKSKY